MVDITPDAFTSRTLLAPFLRLSFVGSPELTPFFYSLPTAKIIEITAFLVKSKGCIILGNKRRGWITEQSSQQPEARSRVNERNRNIQRCCIFDKCAFMEQFPVKYKPFGHISYILEQLGRFFSSCTLGRIMWNVKINCFLFWKLKKYTKSIFWIRWKDRKQLIIFLMFAISNANMITKIRRFWGCRKL